MTLVRRTIDYPIDDVFAILVDPWTYPGWLIGAKEMRSVDPSWPAPGSSFHHRFGLGGPLTIADSSTSKAIRAPTTLVLEARAHPVGRARVMFHLTALSPTSTDVGFAEDPIGPARLIAPLAGLLSTARNKRSLRNLDQFLLVGHP